MEILILSQLIPLFIGFENSINNGIFLLRKILHQFLLIGLLLFIYCSYPIQHMMSYYFYCLFKKVELESNLYILRFDKDSYTILWYDNLSHDIGGIG